VARTSPVEVVLPYAASAATTRSSATIGAMIPERIEQSGSEQVICRR
jgi:hypothetical protein